MAQDRPIFVVGYQRSGTTLLQALLGAHHRIAGPPETHFIFRNPSSVPHHSVATYAASTTHRR